MPKPAFKTVAFTPDFYYHLTASDEEIDQLGHVSNMIYLRWVQHAAAAHSESVGLDIAAFKKMRKMFVVREHQITYLQPAFANEKITCVSWLESYRGASAIRKTRIVRDRDEAELARAITRWVLVDIESGRPRRIPKAIVDVYRRSPITTADEIAAKKMGAESDDSYVLPPIFPDAHTQ